MNRVEVIFSQKNEFRYVNKKNCFGAVKFKEYNPPELLS